MTTARVRQQYTWSYECNTGTRYYGSSERATAPQMVSYEEGDGLIRCGFMGNMTPGEARKLAAILAEAADIAEGKG